MTVVRRGLQKEPMLETINEPPNIDGVSRARSSFDVHSAFTGLRPTSFARQVRNLLSSALAASAHTYFQAEYGGALLVWAAQRATKPGL